MKRIFWLYLANVLVLFLFGWQLIIFFLANTQLANITESSPQSSWEITMNLVPFAFIILVGGIITTFNYRKTRKLISSFFLPSEFIEEDEREKMITAKACRTSYIAMWFSSPVLAGIMSYYSLFEKTFPYFPLLIFLMLPLIQVTAYFFSIRKNI